MRLLFGASVFLSILSISLHARDSLFDGKSLAGWEGDTNKIWRVRDGAIVGGSMEGNPRNEFLATKSRYNNFSLRLQYKIVGTDGFVNGGVQFRSKRLANPPNEVFGYQADIGAGFSGALYDESRRKKVLAAPSKELVAEIEKTSDWNNYEIICEGPRIRIRLNGTITVDYVERAPGIDEEGIIALQIHGKSKAEIAFRNITIEPLPQLSGPPLTDVLKRFGDLSEATQIPGWRGNAFALENNEVIVFTGQANLVRDQESGVLEGLLATAFADRNPRFRSMAWEGDTVYEQWRDLNFGSWSEQLTAAGATIVVAQFGQMEAFDGLNRLPEFSAAYHRLLDQFAARTSRLVLISPMPFESPPAAHMPDLTVRNQVVQAYAEAVRELARRHSAVFVDLFTPLAKRDAGSARITDNGIHLNSEGLRVVAALVAKQLGASATKTEQEAGNEMLQNAIDEKNRLWLDCWRPANWSFVYGDRITQQYGKGAGSRPSLQSTFESYKPLIASLDARIHALALGRPIPQLSAPAPEPSPKSTMLTPEEERETFTLAEGYEINLFASERDGVTKPTHLAWDERGRLLVACSPTYPQTLPGVKPSDYVLVLEDRDGDGRADKSVRFAEGLTMVLGVEVGARGVYVCSFDRLLHLQDIDGDSRADKQTVLLSGFGIGDTHQLINSPSRGPDGTLWFTQGFHAYSRVETPWGIERLEKSGIWRLHPRTMRLDGFFNGGKAGHNCWGVVFDDYGQVFHKSADRPDGYYTVPGMVRVADPDEYHRVGSLFGTTPKTNALEIIGTTALPDDVQGCAIVTGYFGNVVELHRFKNDGAGFITEQLPKLLRSSSKSFRPVDVSVGPDGAIYIADWINPVIGHYQASYADPERDRAHGRIWRITAKGRPSSRAPALASMSAFELLDQLRSPERWTRYQAKRLLFDAPSADVISSADAWLNKLDPRAPEYERLLFEVIGIYEAHEVTRPALLKTILNARDARIRAYGARVVGAWAGRLSNPLAALRVCINDEDPRVRLETIVATSYVEEAEAVEVALGALNHPRDRFIDYALAQAVRALEPYWRPALIAKKLTFGGNAAHAAYLQKATGGATMVQSPGKAIYESLCLSCHQPEGQGLPGVYPPLAGSEWVTGEEDVLIKIVLHGLSGPITVGNTVYGDVPPLVMPPMGLDDQQAAEVLTYLRQNFGNSAPPVIPESVQAVRRAHTDRVRPWTANELGQR